MSEVRRSDEAMAGLAGRADLGPRRLMGEPVVVPTLAQAQATRAAIEKRAAELAVALDPLTPPSP